MQALKTTDLYSVLDNATLVDIMYGIDQAIVAKKGDEMALIKEMFFLIEESLKLERAGIRTDKRYVTIKGIYFPKLDKSGDTEKLVLPNK